MTYQTPVREEANRGKRMKIYREAVGKEWRKWFAWYPVCTEDSEWVWLEVVERRYFNCPIPNVMPSSWIIYRRTN